MFTGKYLALPLLALLGSKSYWLTQPLKEASMNQPNQKNQPKGTTPVGKPAAAPAGKPQSPSAKKPGGK